MDLPLPRRARRPLLDALALALLGGVLGLLLNTARASPLPLDRPVFPGAGDGAAFCGAPEEGGGDPGLCLPEAGAP